MNRPLLTSSILAGCFAFTACGGGGGGGAPTPSDTPPPPISFSHVFPQGDATATQGTAWDIVGVKTTLTGQFGDRLTELYDTLRVDVTFAQDISNALPAPGQSLELGSELGVGLLFDTDANVRTGGFATCALGTGVTPFEYASDPGQLLARLADGNYSILIPGGPIYSGTPNPQEEAAVTVSGKTFSETFYLPSLGLDTGTKIPRIGLQVGSLNGKNVLATDCAPAGALEIYTDQSS